ncbi:MAG: RlmE family RNA methyltransferase [Deltaproteobacteria bacterium]|nr:RlmE family RNA methyltransferase [Deltaproteobacteria bacterium]
MYERKDAFYREAKARGLRSRAAFKLEDLDRRVLRPGDRVVDLGCWPGGWLQVAARRVGDRGRVVGVDLRRLDPLGLAAVRVIQGDVADPATLARVAEALEGPADVVLSDLSPQLSGIRERDEARATELVRLALSFVGRLLRPGGSLVCKIFMNADYPALLAETRSRFGEVTTARSQATRKGSAELYLIARGLRAAPLNSS